MTENSSPLGNAVQCGALSAVVFKLSSSPKAGFHAANMSRVDTELTCTVAGTYITANGSVDAAVLLIASGEPLITPLQSRYTTSYTQRSGTHNARSTVSTLRAPSYHCFCSPTSPRHSSRPFFLSLHYFRDCFLSDLFLITHQDLARWLHALESAQALRSAGHPEGEATARKTRAKVLLQGCMGIRIN